jgi:hypothetical protein
VRKLTFSSSERPRAPKRSLCNAASSVLTPSQFRLSHIVYVADILTANIYESKVVMRSEYAGYGSWTNDYLSNATIASLTIGALRSDNSSSAYSECMNSATTYIDDPLVSVRFVCYLVALVWAIIHCSLQCPLESQFVTKDQQPR